jgi:hypothetical protein
MERHIDVHILNPSRPEKVGSKCTVRIRNRRLTPEWQKTITVVGDRMVERK